jgi:predicted N-formylglutamate amidohydrolase
MMSKAAPTGNLLLGPEDPRPVGVRNPGADSPFLLISDHAGNAVPVALNDLGLPRSELDRHIGIDIGILGVSERLSDLLQAPLVFQRYSRLVVECNRRLTSPDSIALVSDGTVVPGNAGLDAEARRQRVAEIVEPYHREIVGRLEYNEALKRQAILVSMHSFTPSLLARPAPRPWHIGLCYGADRRFTLPMLAALDKQTHLIVGRNEPYAVDMAKDYSIPVHGEGRGLPYAEIEIRQDLIASAEGQRAWAERLAGVLREAYAAYTETSS